MAKLPNPDDALKSLGRNVVHVARDVLGAPDALVRRNVKDAQNLLNQGHAAHAERAIYYQRQSTVNKLMDPNTYNIDDSSFKLKGPR